MRKKFSKLLWALACVSAVVFLGFLLFTLLIGGDASAGCQTDGRYFVSDHGQLKEVSAVIWMISYQWSRLFWWGFPAMIVFGLAGVLLSSENQKG